MWCNSVKYTKTWEGKNVEKAYQEMKTAKEAVEKVVKQQVEKEARAEQQAKDDATKITEVLVDLTIYGAL